MINIGKIARTVGLKGDLRFHPYADDSSIAEDLNIFLDETAYQISELKPFKGQYTIHLDGLDTIEAVEKLVGKQVWIRREDIELSEDEYLVAELIGLKAITKDGQELGTVSDVLTRTAQQVLVIQGQQELLIPFVEAFVRTVDMEQKTIEIEPIEGML